MAAWLLLEPLKPTSNRERYLVTVSESGGIETTQMPLLAKRFATPQAARVFAGRFEGVLDEFRVVRR